MQSWIDRKLADKLARGGEFHDFAWLARVRIDWGGIIIRGDQISVWRQQKSHRTMQVYGIPVNQGPGTLVRCRACIGNGKDCIVLGRGNIENVLRCVIGETGYCHYESLRVAITGISGCNLRQVQYRELAARLGLELNSSDGCRADVRDK